MKRIVNVTPLLQSGRRQHVLRFKHEAIDSLVDVLPLRSTNGKHETLDEFMVRLAHSRTKKPAPYTRDITVAAPSMEPIDCIATFSYTSGKSTRAQGNITGPRGSWFAKWIDERLNLGVRIVYEARADRDWVTLIGEES